MKILFVIVGLIIIGCAIGFFCKEKYKSAITCILLSVIMLLMDPASFQGFLKTGIISILNAYGRRINELQDTLVGQQEDLKRNQRDLAFSQSCVTNQQTALSQQQKKLEHQQDAIDKQHLALAKVRDEMVLASDGLAKQQTNVDSLVRSVFAERETEVFYPSDTNRIVHTIRGTNALWLVFKLKKVPIQNSVLGYYDNSVMKPPINCVRNVAYAIFVGNWENCKKIEYRLSYILNPKANQLFDRVNVRNDEVFCDNQNLGLPREEGSNQPSDLAR